MVTIRNANPEHNVFYCQSARVEVVFFIFVKHTTDPARAH